MDKGFLKLTNYTETASSPKTWAKSVMHGDGDPGYRLTACERLVLLSLYVRSFATRLRLPSIAQA